VRQAGLRWALASPAPSTTNLVRARCKDRNASVRALALAALPGQHGQILQEARDTFLGTGPARDRAVALDVICELDPAAASVQCEQGCADRAAIVRERAYGRRFRMAQGEERDALVPLSLSDPSPRVRGLAAKQVARGVSAPGAERLLSIVDADPAALGSVARVAAHLSPWIRLAFLLAALPRFAGHQATVQRLHLELERWIADMSRCFVSPSGEQRGPVSRAWAAARDELPAAIQRRVSDQMQAFGLLRS